MPLWLYWILLGLLAGTLAKFLVPGRDPSGCIVTIVLGTVGAFIGGLIGDVALGHDVRPAWHLGPFLLAVAGSVVLLLALEALAGRRRRW